MEFLITRSELQIIFLLCRTKVYDLTEDGHLSQPKKWCGQTKVTFRLRTVCLELAKLNDLEPLDDETIKVYWLNILLMRQQKELDSVKKNQIK